MGEGLVNRQEKKRLERLLSSSEHAYEAVREMQVSSNRWEDATIELVKGDLWWIVRELRVMTGRHKLTGEVIS